jgi:hypothetical protein
MVTLLINMDGSYRSIKVVRSLGSTDCFAAEAVGHVRRLSDR